jgi:hypothetical protein
LAKVCAFEHLSTRGFLHPHLLCSPTHLCPNRDPIPICRISPAVMSLSKTASARDPEAELNSNSISYRGQRNDKSENLVTAAQQVPHQFPEGGTKAWLVVVGCWCVSFASFGMINSFGVYETHYIQTLLSNRTPSEIAWIGSIQAFAQFSATLISGPVTDRYGAMV